MKRNRFISIILIIIFLLCYFVSFLFMCKHIKKQNELAVQRDIQLLKQYSHEYIQPDILEQETPAVSNIWIEDDTPIYHIIDNGLDEDLQVWIYDYSYDNNISPALVIAIIEQESRCDPTRVGDSGKSYGLMQIQPKWNKDIMNSLGVTDLLDAKQNIMTGIAILNNYKKTNSDLSWVLMAYNGGPSYANNKYNKGIISDYAKNIMKRTEQLEDEYEMCML